MKLKQTDNSRSIEIDANTLKLLNFETVEARTIASDVEVRDLLTELQNEQSAHTWQNFIKTDFENLFSKIQSFEASKRPTQFFFYYGISSGKPPVLIGVGTVAMKVSNGFSQEGFPVLARCFIRPAHRNFRLYMPILKHRFAYCQEIFGDQLKGIHLGSQNPRIFSVIKKNLFDLPFFYLGDEFLMQKGEAEIVRDFLWLTKNFQSQVIESANQFESTFSGRKMRESFQKLFENRFDSRDFGQLCHYYEQSLIEFPDLKNQNSALDQLMNLMETIGIMKDPLPAQNNVDEPIRRAANLNRKVS